MSHQTHDEPVKTKPKSLRPYHVVLLDDNEHTLDYVVEMLQKLFGHSDELAQKMGMTVHKEGRVIVATTHKESAEFKRDQIRSYGPDPLLGSDSTRSMNAIVEPAE